MMMMNALNQVTETTTTPPPTTKGKKKIGVRPKLTPVDDPIDEHYEDDDDDVIGLLGFTDIHSPIMVTTEIKRHAKEEGKVVNTPPRPSNEKKKKLKLTPHSSTHRRLSSYGDGLGFNDVVRTPLSNDNTDDEEEGDDQNDQQIVLEIDKVHSNGNYDTNSLTADNNHNHRSNNNNSNSSSRRKATRRTSTIDESKYCRPGRHKHAAILELIYGSILYLGCILLPTVPHYMVLLYQLLRQICEKYILWYIWITYKFITLVLLNKDRWYVRGVNWIVNMLLMMITTTTTTTTTTIYDDDRPTKQLGKMRYRLLLKRIRKLFFDKSTIKLWEEFNHNDSIRQQSWGVLLFDHYRATNTTSTTITTLLFLTFLLAIVRIWFVHMLVPEGLTDTLKLEAMTRVKSTHLLCSASYTFGTSNSSNRDNGSMDNNRNCSIINNDNRGAIVRNKLLGMYDRIRISLSQRWYTLRPSVRRALDLRKASSIYNDDRQEQQQLYPHSMSMPALRRTSISSSIPTTTLLSTQQIFMAPRFATATFRLLYTSISCISALVLFQSAEWWPTYVFGTHPQASTRNCWDLSGSFILLDDDINDDTNNVGSRSGALRYFFLAQVAFQLHSLCFHFVSILLLLLYGGAGRSSAVVGCTENNSSDGNQRNNLSRKQNQQPLHKQRRRRRLVSLKSSTQSYFRPMMEHIIVLALLIGAYLFSGLRRLGAVAIFNMELSSSALQLLQVCIYSPEKSILRKRKVVLFVHRVLTIPTFIYCRLFVMPFVLWRSALFESHEWLEQIEKVFSLEWSRRLYALFNGSLCLIFVLNLVLFRRLLFHPHLKQIDVMERMRTSQKI